MPAKTAEATCSDVSGIFDQTFRAWGDSFKVVMKAQEDTLQYWNEAAGKVNPMPAIAGEWMPVVQKNADEYLHIMESGCRRNADLVKKAMQNPNGGEGIGMEKRGREWVEACMEAARDNAQELANTNMHVAQAWADMIKKCMQQGQQKAAAAK